MENKVINSIASKPINKLENLHIVFWLLKDIAWCMIWKPLGIAMVLPTLFISVIIACKYRHLKHEVYHNVAIICWITANSYWMISEFFNFDALHLFHQFTYKQIAIIPFFIGLCTLTWYYLYVKNKD